MVHFNYRYTVKVTEDHLASLQISTSKSDVYLRLSVLDHETEILGTVGKGHAVLPAVFFMKDGGAAEEEVKRTSSRTCTFVIYIYHLSSQQTQNIELMLV